MVGLRGFVKKFLDAWAACGGVEAVVGDSWEEYRIDTFEGFFLKGVGVEPRDVESQAFS